MFKLINVMEILVLDVLDEVLRTRKDICDCERCRLDLAAICLNKLPPSYVVTLEGEIFLRTNALRQQFKVDVYSVITQAVAVVSKHPHHN
ncbi:MAG: late competence development ComFB family protein [Eubacteriales bacterium]